MAWRLSKALRNFLNAGGSFREAMNGGQITFYQGPQPTNADDVVQGTPLCVFTKGSAARTAEVLAVGGFTIAGGAGSFDTLTVNALDILGGAVPFNASLTQTALDICAKINDNPKNVLFKATSLVAVVTLTAKPGPGSLANGWVVTPGSSGGITTNTLVNMAGGVTAVNGLTWDVSAAGTMNKNPLETWSGAAISDGTAGWFRVTAAVADAGAADAGEVYMRADGAIAASGAELNGSTSIINLAVQTINAMSITVPAQ